MPIILLALVVAALMQTPTIPFTHADIAPGPESFTMRVIASGFDGPWETRWGPDNQIWVTERVPGRITRVNPVDGSKKVVLTIPDVLQNYAQNGLLGLALHSGFLTPAGPNYLYIAMTYDVDPGPEKDARLMIRRYTYDAKMETLGEPADLVTNIPSGTDHISGRLMFGRDAKLYLSVGDKGVNQFDVYCQPIRAQVTPTAAEIAARDWQAYEGKVLRVNLDGSIPADNPLIAGVRSHIFTYGHRNAQGLVTAPDGKVYEAEHGPSMDDELNLLEAGKNYGWPFVAGYRDDRAYVYANWSAAAPAPCRSLKWDAIVAPASVPQQKETAWNAPNFMAPIRTFFTVDTGWDFTARGNATIAPSGIEFYSRSTGGIPGWSDSILVTSLLRGVVYRVKVGPGGTSTTGKSFEYFHKNSRYRNVFASADGRTIYVVADNGSAENAGSILAFTYQPPR